MKRQNDHDAANTLQQLTLAAAAFVNRAPKVRRIDHERAALLDAITHAELVLSVKRLPQEEKERKQEPTTSKRTALLEEEIRQLHATLNELTRPLRPLREQLEELQTQARKAKDSVDTALAASESSSPHQEKDGGLAKATVRRN